MNHHLNLFRFFNESTEKEFIENNLTRAFAICLTNNSLFFNEYLRSIVSKEDYESLFDSNSDEQSYSIDVQVNTENIERESFKTVYAVAMTSDKDLDISDFFSQPVYKDKQNITDLIITIKDTIVIIEVKRTGEDCKAQLFNQIYPFQEDNNKYKITPKSFSWQETIKLMERVKNIQNILSQSSIFINDFLKLSEIRFPDWFEPKPFNIISFVIAQTTINYNQLARRLHQALSQTKYDFFNAHDRYGLNVPFHWASEIIPEFDVDENDKSEYIKFYVWPGNTKGQGYHLYNKSLDWQNKKSLMIDGIEYKLGIDPNMKFCHFNRYVSDITFKNSDYTKPLHTKDNFNYKSGKWDRVGWSEFEQFMDEHFKPEFNWREHCKWQERFINTDRNYFTMSLGYSVYVYIPYNHFKKIDKTDNDIIQVSEFINKMVEAFKNLIR